MGINIVSFIKGEVCGNYVADPFAHTSLWATPSAGAPNGCVRTGEDVDPIMRHGVAPKYTPAGEKLSAPPPPQRPRRGAAAPRSPQWLLILGLWVLGLAPVLAQDAFDQGEALFLLNKPREAVPFLERSLEEDPANIRAGLYLGISYQQLDLLDDAIAVFKKILPRGGDETARIAFNLGNVYYHKGSAPSAEQYYTQAIQADPAYASAYLNRGNILTQAGSLTEAAADYELYLSLEPRSSKRPRIEALLAAIKEEFAAAERRRIEAEQAARAEAERKQRLLDEISASLHAAAEDTTGLSAGAEEVLGYDDSFELE